MTRSESLEGSVSLCIMFITLLMTIFSHHSQIFTAFPVCCSASFFAFSGVSSEVMLVLRFEKIQILLQISMLLL